MYLIDSCVILLSYYGESDERIKPRAKENARNFGVDDINQIQPTFTPFCDLFLVRYIKLLSHRKSREYKPLFLRRNYVQLNEK